MDDLHTWRSSHHTVVRRSPAVVSRLSNSAFRLRAVPLPGNPHLSGRSMTSPLAHRLNPRCLILLILHPTASSMISRTGHPLRRSGTVPLTIRHLLFKFPRPHDLPDRKVRITSRASRLAWRTLRGKSCQLPCESIKLITMIGKIMLCSSAMVLLVRGFWSSKTPSGNVGILQVIV